MTSTTEQKTEQDSAQDPQALMFSLAGTPFLSVGRFDERLGSANGFGARIKVYAEGGENASHAHLTEDHLFLVLAGQATFFLGRQGEDMKVVNKYDGILLPRGAFYRFASSGDENLVLFRVGCQSEGEKLRLGSDGKPLGGHSKENGHIDGIPIPGRFFA